ncbi:hypothetical protein GDN83_12070 [Gordonia jinghuaiqii]|uniref:DUF2079 domain-containing protein n=1 Tax=Gordonia jinghuaiqii TaxID=2758710 RepID=A0A7D7R1M8_9ACTN|nr:hypothetical protein [Gordonia jinghuaiqii]MCR5978452.1 hypothetical protein [Gordonia jinghuaiqii]QMT02791.1 hypothetical protein H1R19_06555 [Gordonia jinghuaiqii]
MPNARMVSLIAVSLIVGQLIIRGVLAVTGNFYWDDLVLIAQASSNPIISWDYLGHSHDGHFMPAAFLVAGVTTWLAPLNWTLAAVTLIVLQALASVAVWRMIRVLAPQARGGALVALGLYLFSPMTVPAFAWWSAGLNTLPMQAAMAWIVADAVRLGRGDVDPSRRRAVWLRSTVVFVIALAFFEKSLFIFPVALVAAVLANGGIRRLTPTLRAGRELWISLGVVSALWTVVYFVVSDPTAGQHSVAQTARLVWRSVNHAIVPSLVGGPWEWDRWTPSPPTGLPAVWMIVGGWLVVAAVAWWGVTRKRGAAAILLAAALYAVAAQIPVMWNRSSPETALALAQHMRYLPDTALVLAIAVALLCAAPSRAAHEQRRAAERSPGVLLLPVAAAFAVVSALVSLVSFSASWRDNPTGDYLETAVASLHDSADQMAPDQALLDQSVPLEILQPVVYPDNQISRIFGRVDPRPAFGVSTDRLLVLDTAGNLVPGGVTQRRLISAGDGTCGAPEVTGPTELGLDGPLFPWVWTIALSYCATRDGEIEVSLDDGDAVRVPVRAGLGAMYVRLDGGGDAIDVRPVTAGLRLHTGAGRVGEAVEARFAGG